MTELEGLADDYRFASEKWRAAQAATITAEEAAIAARMAEHSAHALRSASHDRLLRYLDPTLPGPFVNFVSRNPPPPPVDIDGMLRKSL